VSSWAGTKLLYTNDVGSAGAGSYRVRGSYEPEDVEPI
jgi:hypothetical protein